MASCSGSWPSWQRRRRRSRRLCPSALWGKHARALPGRTLPPKPLYSAGHQLPCSCSAPNHSTEDSTSSYSLGAAASCAPTLLFAVSRETLNPHTHTHLERLRGCSLSLGRSVDGERRRLAPAPPCMPAPSPRPSSRAPARLGARCPSATDREALTEAGRLLPSSTPRRSGPPASSKYRLPCPVPHSCAMHSRENALLGVWRRPVGTDRKGSSSEGQAGAIPSCNPLCPAELLHATSLLLAPGQVLALCLCVQLLALPWPLPPWLRTLPRVAFGCGGQPHALQLADDLVLHRLGDAREDRLKVVLQREEGGCRATVRQCRQPELAGWASSVRDCAVCVQALVL